MDLVEYNGISYQIRPRPRRGWPCEACDLRELCTAENMARNDWPPCRRNDRDDGRDVVFRLPR